MEDSLSTVQTFPCPVSCNIRKRKMEAKHVPEVVLNSGNKIPVIGLGTSSMPPPTTDVLTSIFVDAIQIGYRHLDTASIYGSEEAVGRAVAEALKRGLIKSRQEIFITSKLWCTDAHPDLVLPALKATLQRLGLEYVDLYLFHWPLRLRKETQGLNITKEDFLPFDGKGTWEAMEQCYKLGLAKSIGVSNYSTKKLQDLLQHATIPPAVNQVEMNVGWQQGKLIDFCKKKGIYVAAWSPLGANGAVWGSLAVMESPILEEIAASKGKTVAQIALRWIYEQGAIPIVKSFNKERMKANLELFDWELSEDEKEKIKQIPQKKGFSGQIFVFDNAPYKTLEELWDNEI